MALPTQVSRLHQYDPIEAAQREFDQVLGRFFGNRENNGTAWSPYPVDVREDKDHFYVEAELPGFRKEDVDVTLENQMLTITATRQEATSQGDQNKGEWLLRERRFNRFIRSFTLPPTVEEHTVNAKLDQGVLTITLNKREETKPRKVQVA